MTRLSSVTCHGLNNLTAAIDKALGEWIIQLEEESYYIHGHVRVRLMETKVDVKNKTARVKRVSVEDGRRVVLWRLRFLVILGIYMIFHKDIDTITHYQTEFYMN